MEADLHSLPFKQLIRWAWSKMAYRRLSHLRKKKGVGKKASERSFSSKKLKDLCDLKRNQKLLNIQASVCGHKKIIKCPSILRAEIKVRANSRKENTNWKEQQPGDLPCSEPFAQQFTTYYLCFKVPHWGKASLLFIGPVIKLQLQKVNFTGFFLPIFAVLSDMGERNMQWTDFLTFKLLLKTLSVLHRIPNRLRKIDIALEEYHWIPIHNGNKVGFLMKQSQLHLF